MLVKRLARVEGGLVGEAQTYTIPGRSINGNLRLIRYSLERVGKTPSKYAALVHLCQSEAFDKVNHEYIRAVLEVGKLSKLSRSLQCTVESSLSFE